MNISYAKFANEAQLIRFTLSSRNDNVLATLRVQEALGERQSKMRGKQTRFLVEVDRLVNFMAGHVVPLRLCFSNVPRQRPRLTGQGGKLLRHGLRHEPSEHGFLDGLHVSQPGLGSK